MEAERVAIDGGGREKPMAGSRVRKGLRWRQPRSQRHGRFRAWACSKRRAIGSLARLVEHKSRLPAGRWPVALIYHRSFLRCYGLTVYSVLASYIQSPRWLCAARTRIYIYIYITGSPWSAYDRWIDLHARYWVGDFVVFRLVITEQIDRRAIRSHPLSRNPPE